MSKCYFLKRFLFRKIAITSLANILVSYLKESCKDVKFKHWNIIIAGQINSGFQSHGLQPRTDGMYFMKGLSEALPRYYCPRMGVGVGEKAQSEITDNFRHCYIQGKESHIKLSISISIFLKKLNYILHWEQKGHKWYIS